MLGEHSKSFSSVLPTSKVGYHAGKPIESVVYCLNILKLRYVLKSIKVAQSRSRNLLGFCYLPPTLRSKRFLARFVQKAGTRAKKYSLNGRT